MTLIDKTELLDQIIVSRKLGRVTHSLGESLMRITDITMKRYFVTLPVDVYENMASDITCALLEQARKMEVINADKTFAYLLRKAKFQGLDTLKKMRADRHEYTETLDKVLTDFAVINSMHGEDKQFYISGANKVKGYNNDD